MRVKNMITIRQGLTEGQAEFWLMRRGDAEVCGRPMRLEDFTDNWNKPRPDYARYHWGVNLLESCPFDGSGVWYHLQALWAKGRFARFAHGSLNLNNITKRGILDRHIFTEQVYVQLPPKRVILEGKSYFLEPDGAIGFESEPLVITNRTAAALRNVSDDLEDILHDVP